MFYCSWPSGAKHELFYYMHTYKHAYIHTFILAYINRYVHTYIRTCRHLCTCTYVHSYNKQTYSTMVNSKQNSRAQRVRREERRKKQNNDQHLDSKLPEHLLLLPDCFPSHAATALCRNLRSLNCLNSHFVAVSAVSKCPKLDNHRVGRIQAWSWTSPTSARAGSYAAC